MARTGPLLTEAQWKKIAPLLPKPPRHRRGGRPWIENRRVLEGILWILRSGARWQDLPEKYPHPSTCWRRLWDWEEQGVVMYSTCFIKLINVVAQAQDIRTGHAQPKNPPAFSVVILVIRGRTALRCALAVVLRKNFV